MVGGHLLEPERTSTMTIGVVEDRIVEEMDVDASRTDGSSTDRVNTNNINKCCSRC